MTPHRVQHYLQVSHVVEAAAAAGLSIEQQASTFAGSWFVNKAWLLFHFSHMQRLTAPGFLSLQEGSSGCRSCSGGCGIHDDSRHVDWSLCWIDRRSRVQQFQQLHAGRNGKDVGWGPGPEAMITAVVKAAEEAPGYREPLREV